MECLSTIYFYVTNSTYHCRLASRYTTSMGPSKTTSCSWVVWSTIGFGLFYAPMTFATIYGPGWLVAATFQLTIIAGSLLVPLLNKGSRIPIQAILISLIILAGVCIIQFE